MSNNVLISAAELLLPKWLLNVLHHEDFFLYFTAFLGVVMPSCVFFFYQYIYGIYIRKAKERRERHRRNRLLRSAITIFYAIRNNADEPLPFLVANRFQKDNPPVVNLATVKRKNFLKFQGIGLFIICTVEKGREPEHVEWFFDWLEELVGRRRSKRRRCRMRFAVMGYGDFVEGLARHNRAARTLAKRLQALGGTQIYPLYLVNKKMKRSLEEHADLWVDCLLPRIESSTTSSSSSSSTESGTTTTSFGTLPEFGFRSPSCSKENSQVFWSDA